VKRFLPGLLGLLVVVLMSEAHASQNWTEGTNYVVLSQPQPTSVPRGKVEVMEVFSYGCIACNGFQPVIAKLEKGLPPSAKMVFLPASFRTDEDWPMLQRAYFAAQSIGIAERTHQEIFNAVWKTGELGISDPVTHRLKSPQPTLEDAARCYGRLAGIKPEEFLSAAHSFGVEMKIKAADAQVMAMQVPGTPCIVVNGKYRLELDSLRSSDEIVDLVNYLVAKESRH
jgi:thiol:disulfide interchange protein DsbA